MSTEAAPINVGLRGEESDGQVAMIENIISVSFAGLPLHLHDFDEGLYVIDGELTCQVPPGLRTGDLRDAMTVGSVVGCRSKGVDDALATTTSATEEERCPRI